MLFCNINLISNAVQLLLFFVVFSETPSQLQRRNVSFIIPNTEDGKKRVLVQSQLLDGMLSWVVILLHFYYIFHNQTTLSTSMLKVISNIGISEFSEKSCSLYAASSNWICLCFVQDS